MIEGISDLKDRIGREVIMKEDIYDHLEDAHSRVLNHGSLSVTLDWLGERVSRLPKRVVERFVELCGCEKKDQEEKDLEKFMESIKDPSFGLSNRFDWVTFFDCYKFLLDYDEHHRESYERFCDLEMWNRLNLDIQARRIVEQDLGENYMESIENSYSAMFNDRSLENIRRLYPKRPGVSDLERQQEIDLEFKRTESNLRCRINVWKNPMDERKRLIYFGVPLPWKEEILKILIYFQFHFDRTKSFDEEGLEGRDSTLKQQGQMTPTNNNTRSPNFFDQRYTPNNLNQRTPTSEEQKNQRSPDTNETVKSPLSTFTKQDEENYQKPIYLFLNCQQYNRTFSSTFSIINKVGLEEEELDGLYTETTLKEHEKDHLEDALRIYKAMSRVWSGLEVFHVEIFLKMICNACHDELSKKLKHLPR
ncbi:expressed protein [Phakopsora pachyrhizi]|uniref:Expressed protein n=1 Tax=Phakopsora pachyrhizi TaxID=170000 RepID=A0AAV0B8T7_PHAPC|nr:expressed protein [Phakopsora pachyrhizi]